MRDQHELFAERPIRSDLRHYNGGEEGELSPLRIGIIVLIVVAIGLGIYWLAAPATQETTQDASQVPVIGAEMPLKERPQNPGGIEIPHRDVTMFQDMSKSNSANKTIGSGAEERLLPPPETPILPTDNSDHATTVDAVTNTTAPENITQSAAVPDDSNVISLAPNTTKSTPTTVASAPVIPTSPEPIATDAPITLPLPPDVVPIKEAAPERLPLPTAPPSVTAKTSGIFVVQMASLPDMQKAEAQTKNMNNKYKTALGSSKLRIVRADLAGKGTWYRIRSEPLSEASARALCTSLKEAGGSCIVARQ